MGIAVMGADEIRHLGQGGPGEEDFVHAVAVHDRGIGLRDGPAAAAEKFDIVRALPSQRTRHF
jgi:hypothetical protein